MSVTGTNAGNFSNRIKRLFNIYPNLAQSRSKGIFAIGFLIVYLGIVLAGANVTTGHPVEQTMTTSIDNQNIVSNTLSDSTRVNLRLRVPEEKAITLTLQPVVEEKILSMDIQWPDSTVKDRSLDNCIKEVDLMLKMASINRLPGEKFKVQEAEITVELQPTRVYGTLNQSRSAKEDLTAGTVKEVPVRLEIQEPTPLYIVDGVRVDKIMLDELPGASINSITVYKGQQAIDVYGDDGMNGIIEIKLKPGTSIEEFVEPVAVQVFPNSTHGQLNISFTPARNNARVKMVLVDSDGKVVKEITNSTYDNTPTELHVDVSGYKKGIYILQVNIDGAKSQQRVVVE